MRAGKPAVPMTTSPFAERKDERGPSDALSFEEVAARYYSRVYRVALHLTSRREDAEDVCQEVFLYLSKHLGDFRGESAIFTWIYRITRSTAFKLGRRKRPIPLPEGRETPAPDSIERPAESEEKKDAIRQAFARLPDNSREVAALHLLEGLPLKEIAEILEAPEGTIRWWMFKARETLREELREWANP
jgi:RNA polymerase sigma-70 factor (ECF subfamily)